MAADDNELPLELKESVTALPIDSSRFVYILGTAHVCTKSSADARALIQWAKPTHVMLELCEGRRSCLEYRPQVFDCIQYFIILFIQ
jgi:pheromone shutdown protein TraB